MYWFVLNPYLTSVNTTCLRSFGEYFFNWRRSGVLRLFLEVRYKRSPDSLCSSVIFTRMVSPFYYSAAAALAIFTSFVVSFKWYTVRTWVISSSFVKVYRWSCYFVVCTTFCFSSLLKCDVQVLPLFVSPLVCEFDSILMIFINFNSITKLFCKVKLLDRFF